MGAMDRRRRERPRRRRRDGGPPSPSGTLLLCGAVALALAIAGVVVDGRVTTSVVLSALLAVASFTGAFLSRGPDESVSEELPDEVERIGHIAGVGSGWFLVGMAVFGIVDDALPMAAVFLVAALAVFYREYVR